ncbi:MAG: hypothetical protein IBJ09_14865 [Bacteroidia bacterium]|nr:hypothetical protein [Bacteroidia bacterium]
MNLLHRSLWSLLFLLTANGLYAQNIPYRPEVSVGYTLLNRPEAEVRFPVNRYRNLFIHAGFSYRFRVGVGAELPNPKKPWRYAPSLFFDLFDYKGFGIQTGISYSSWSRRFTYSFLTGYSALQGYKRYSPGITSTVHYQSRINANVYHFILRTTLFIGPRRITGIYAEAGAAVNSGNRDYAPMGNSFYAPYEPYAAYRQIGTMFGLGLQFKVYGFLNPE